MSEILYHCVEILDFAILITFWYSLQVYKTRLVRPYHIYTGHTAVTGLNGSEQRYSP